MSTATYTVHCGRGGLTVSSQTHHDYEDYDDALAMEERRVIRRRRRINHRQRRLLLQLRREIDNLQARQTEGGRR